MLLDGIFYVLIDLILRCSLCCLLNCADIRARSVNEVIYCLGFSSLVAGDFQRGFIWHFDTIQKPRGLIREVRKRGGAVDELELQRHSVRVVMHRQRQPICLFSHCQYTKKCYGEGQENLSFC